MKIIIAPSKTQSVLNNCLSFNQPKHLEKSLALFATLKTLSQEELAQVMKIKGKTLEQVYALYQDFDPATSPRQSAIHLYTGVVFEGLTLSSYSPEQVKFMNDHVRILSAMYGVLKPSDCIYNYRLDFTMKFNDVHLNDYWRDDILNEFQDEDLILDLASTEFSQFLKPIQHKLHKVEFIDVVNGREKVISYKAKKLRGLLLNHVIHHNDVDSINTFTSAYQLDQTTKSNHLTRFVKR
jgi:cytoplasmic iron level regulating protein YaaA (DUF328/UPF0246 family)